jgi:hypothetical protein
MNTKWMAILLAIASISGCAMNTTKSDTAKHLLTKSSYPGTFSLYGKSMQRNGESDQMYINVYVGGGGDRDGALHFASNEIEKYSTENGFSSHEIVNSEYTFFPLSKYTFYVNYK